MRHILFRGVFGSSPEAHAGLMFGREVYSKSIGLSFDRAEPNIFDVYPLVASQKFS